MSGAAIVVAMAGAWVATRGDAETATAPDAADDPADASTTATPPKVDTTASGGLLFFDVAPDAGLTEPQSTELLNFGRAMTGGAAVGDYDDDGVYDLYLTRVGLPNQLHRGNGDGTYEDVTDAAGVAGPDPSGGSAAAVWADVDGDDDLDLFVGGTGTARDAMFINNGEGTFADETAQRGLEQPPAPPGPVGSAAFGAAFSDWDQDGDLDLVVTHWNEQALNQFYLKDNAGKDDRLCDAARAPASAAFQAQLDTHPSRARLYRNDGDGNFADATAEMGVDFTRMVGFTPTFADYDDDGWDDLFVTGDFCTSRLFHNDGGTGFSDVTEAAQVGTDEAGMGSVVEDLDGDGHLDWFITAIAADGVEEGCIDALVSVPCSGNRLYLGDGAGGFTDSKDEFGVRDGKWAWGAAADDLNNDGFRDLLVVNGYFDIDGQSAVDGQATPDIARAFERFKTPATRLWSGADDTPWTDVGPQAGLNGTGRGKALVPFDFDGDGDLDLLVANTGAPPHLYRNDSEDQGGWLAVRLSDDTTANRRGVGARISVRLAGVEQPLTDQVRSGGSYQSSEPTDVHFGLGDAVEIESVEVRWPGEAEPQVVEGPNANSVLEIGRSG